LIFAFISPILCAVDTLSSLDLGTNNTPPYLHWLVVCAACGLPTLGRGLTPCSPIARFSSNEVVKCTHCNDIRQYLAAQFFLGPFPKSGPLAAPPPPAKYRYGPTLVIAASIIAAVRLAREDTSVRSPRIVAAIAGSVQLAKDILDAVRRKFPDA
jgi:hypothetical protein